MELITETRKPKFLNPRILLIYGVPKSGKTTIVSHLKDHLLLELEPGGADYIEGRVQEINKPSELNEIINLIKNSPAKVCDYLVIDTCTRMDEWSEIVGTYNYMSQAQGKKFNRVGEDEKGAKILHTDPKFESVHSIGNGYGYRHSRDVMTDWYDKLQDLIVSEKITYVILLAHVKDKYVESKNGDSVETTDINLTGKVKSIYASRVDAIGHFYREEGKGYLSFNNEYKVVCGGRCPHLDGSILISEKQPDKSIKTYWDNIYLK